MWSPLSSPDLGSRPSRQREPTAGTPPPTRDTEQSRAEQTTHPPPSKTHPCLYPGTWHLAPGGTSSPPVHVLPLPTVPTVFPSMLPPPALCTRDSSLDIYQHALLVSTLDLTLLFIISITSLTNFSYHLHIRPQSPVPKHIATMSTAALHFDPGFNHFNMGGRSSFAWPGMLALENLITWSFPFPNSGRCRPRAYPPRHDGPRYWLLQPFRSQPQPSVSPPLPRQQPPQDVGRAAGTQEATRPSAPRLQARSTSAKGWQSLFPGWTIRRRRITSFDQRRLHFNQRPVQHAYLHDRTDRDVIAHRAYDTGTTNGPPSLLLATVFL